MTVSELEHNWRIFLGSCPALLSYLCIMCNRTIINTIMLVYMFSYKHPTSSLQQSQTCTGHSQHTHGISSWCMEAEILQHLHKINIIIVLEDSRASSGMCILKPHFSHMMLWDSPLTIVTNFL